MSSARRPLDEFDTALRRARESAATTVIHVETDPLVPAPSSDAWWDVPVAEVAALDSTRRAREVYDQHKSMQRTFLKTPDTVRTP
jgi:3D-(3,5/4)-trihydroxycyclohexane-1,2-dione acylhydrolase (decyclizing)